MASKGQAKKLYIFPAAVTAATAPDPRVFTADCRITLPMAVMEYCSPMGIPMLQRLAIMWPSGLHSSLDMCRISNFFTIYNRHSRPETPWEITVAHAAPATPSPKLMIKIRSRATLSTEESSRKNTGVLLSPKARMMPDKIL